MSIMTQMLKMNVNTSVMTSWLKGKRQRRRRENRIDTGKTGNKRERERRMWGRGVEE